jgi:hypothetical protein
MWREDDINRELRRLTEDLRRLRSEMNREREDRRHAYDDPPAELATRNPTDTEPPDSIGD